MHKKRRQLNFANDMLEQVEKIRDKFQNISLEEFYENEEIQLVTERRFEIIAEAVTNIEPEILLRIHNDRVYWRIIKDMRNRITHEYWGISLETVYRTAKDNMDELKKYTEALIEEINRELNKEITN